MATEDEPVHGRPISAEAIAALYAIADNMGLNNPDTLGRAGGQRQIAAQEAAQFLLDKERLTPQEILKGVEVRLPNNRRRP